MAHSTASDADTGKNITAHNGTNKNGSDKNNNSTRRKVNGKDERNKKGVCHAAVGLFSKALRVTHRPNATTRHTCPQNHPATPAREKRPHVPVKQHRSQREMTLQDERRHMETRRRKGEDVTLLWLSSQNENHQSRSGKPEGSGGGGGFFFA